MENPDLEKLQTKLAITERAIELYVRQNGTFTFSQIAKGVDLEAGEIFNYFPDKKAILEFYYTSLVIRYRMMIEEIEDFETYTISEKLSNFVFASFDMMAEQQAFVEMSFRDVIGSSYSKTEYEEEIEQLFKSFFENDLLIAASSTWIINNYFFSLMRAKYLKLVRFWLDDTSEGRELTMELTDKYTAFLQEAVYSSVLDKGGELLKFMISNKIFTRNLPFIRTICSKFEIR